MDFLPIFLNPHKKPCLIIGGGPVALRKAELLSHTDAIVTALAPAFHPNFEPLVRSGKVVLRRKAFDSSDLKGFALVIAATDDTTLNATIAHSARKSGLWVNVVDQPELCDFIMPAIVDRSPLIIAVSSGGRAPVLARMIRARLESLIPANFGRLAELAGRFRTRVKPVVPNPKERRRFWERVLQGSVGELMLAGQTTAAAEAMEAALKSTNKDHVPLGHVALVGAGPGDPDLLTFRALRLMQEADTVVFDRLVSAEILALVRRDAEKIYAGKARSEHTLPQEQINHLLVRLAKEGKRVVRLKGGDPFIFGRGGEEIESLAAEKIPFTVVPGITAASGCASYAGIPLTHRDHAQSCLFVTGHRRGDQPNLDWNKLVVPQQTLVIYMGLLGLQEICQALIRHGMAPDMPAALIQSGTTPQQKVIIATVSTLAERAREKNAAAPTLIIIGEVVKLSEKLSWFQGQEKGEEK
ncbi:siroheme synthase CysG [Methylohalobius crimeensis]|uniref:siroheme synthase CysG n=1 Tax=Methylohalobius crimeensis TaxID=244365 RepID=UPI0003B4E7E6|nr:siroheme synthase CysG [Methylohalobius crimeensis]